jgi:hypothetical protein
MTRRARRRLSALPIAFLVVALLTRTRSARADDAAGALGFLLYNLQAVAPSEVGTDLSTPPSGGPRLWLVWGDQFPFGLLGAASWDDERDVPRARHRLVFDAGVVVASPSEVGSPYLDLRIGYRYRTWHRHGVAALVGVGSTYEGRVNALDRAAISPEVGLHIGTRRVVWPGLQLRGQVDVFPADDPRARCLLTVGYTLF